MSVIPRLGSAFKAFSSRSNSYRSFSQGGTISTRHSEKAKVATPKVHVNILRPNKSALSVISNSHQNNPQFSLKNDLNKRPNSLRKSYVSVSTSTICPNSSQCEFYRPSRNTKPPDVAKTLLKNFKKLKYLSNDDIADITSEELDIGFLKNNPKIYLAVLPQSEIRKGRNRPVALSRRVTKNIPKESMKEAPKESAESHLTLKGKINTIRGTKIFLANINKTKQKQIERMIEEVAGVSSSGRTSDSRSENMKAFSIKRSSMMDRFILRLIDPEECMDDYVNDSEKPFDKYTKFKMQCVKKKKKVDEIINDLRKAVSMNEKLLQIYTTRLKGKMRARRRVKFDSNVVV